MRKWGWFLGGLLLVGLTWGWLQSAQVTTGEIDATDYAAGVTASGNVVLTDLQALETAINHIDSSQTDETSYIEGDALQTNDIPYNKLQHRGGDSTAVNWWFRWNSVSDTTLRKILAIGAINATNIDSLFAAGVLQTTETGSQTSAWGDAHLNYPDHGLAAIDLEDTVLADSGWTFMIDFADSSDAGDPGFAASPSYLNISIPYEVTTPSLFGGVSTADDYDSQRNAICDLTFSVVFLSADSCSVHAHNSSADTIAVTGYKVFWEAKE